MKLIVYRNGVKNPKEFLINFEELEHFMKSCCNPLEYHRIVITSTDGKEHIFSINDIVGYEVEDLT